MSQIENHEKTLKETVKSIVYETIHEFNEELQDEYQFKVYSISTTVENYDLNIEIDLSYSIKLMEISYAVGESVEEYIIRIEEETGEEVSEEMAEELFNEFYENELSELNVEYIYPITAKIEYDLSEIYPFYSGGLEIEINPLPCGGDYCDVGAEINIKFKAIRIETVEKASDKFKEFLTDLLRLIHSIITL